MNLASGSGGGGSFGGGKKSVRDKRRDLWESDKPDAFSGANPKADVFDVSHTTQCKYSTNTDTTPKITRFVFLHFVFSHMISGIEWWCDFTWHYFR